MSSNTIDEEERKWELLRNEIADGMAAEVEEFLKLDAFDIIREAKLNKASLHGT